jgi:hypothetical protein
MRRALRHSSALVAACLTLLALPALTRATTYTLRLGDTFTATGQTATVGGKRATGFVRVVGRWGSTGVWRYVTTTRTDSAGRYRFRVKPDRRGVLTLRITPPDKQDKQLVLRVV